MIISMRESEIICDNCKEVIMEYYDEQYGGTRGKCTRCEVNFPLE